MAGLLAPLPLQLLPLSVSLCAALLPARPRRCGCWRPEAGMVMGLAILPLPLASSVLLLVVVSADGCCARLAAGLRTDWRWRGLGSSH